MAWPLSRYQDFVDNTVPAITSAFLHAVQDALSRVYLGTQSIKALVIDGVGGSAVTGRAGTAVVSASQGSAPAGAAPRTPTSANGEVGKGRVAMAWGRVNADGTLRYAVNVYEASYTGSGGIYEVVLNTAPSSTYAWAMQATVVGGGAALAQQETVTIASPGWEITGAGRLRFRVVVYDTGGSGVTRDFTFVVWGE